MSDKIADTSITSGTVFRPGVVGVGRLCMFFMWKIVGQRFSIVIMLFTCTVERSTGEMLSRIWDNKNKTGYGHR